jgi:hypothetical protein
LIPWIFFPRVVPPRAAGSRRLDGLAIDAAGAGFRFLTGRFPHADTERVMDLLPEPAPAPLMEIIADRPFRGEVVRQGGPGTAGAQEVEDSIEDLTEVGRPRRTDRERRRQQRCDEGPLSVVEVAGVGLASLGIHTGCLRVEVSIASGI